MSNEFVRLPRLSASPAIEGITESNSVNSLCSCAFFAAIRADSAAAAIRADSAASAIRVASADVLTSASPEGDSFRT